MPKVGWFSTDWMREPIPDPGSAEKGNPTFKQNFARHFFGGTYYYRMGLPAGELNHHGYECVLAPGLTVGDDGRFIVQDPWGNMHDDCDIVVFQRYMWHEAPAQQRRAMAAGQIIVNDLDDNFWALPKSNVAYQNTASWNNPDMNRDHYRESLKNCSAITVSTKALQSMTERMGPPVTICRNACDMEFLPRQDPRENGLVGWVGAIPWRSADLGVLRGVLPSFLEKYDIGFYHGGVVDDPTFTPAWEQVGINMEKTQVYSRPICELKDYPELWKNLNISLVPLEDNSFNRSKSYLKALESCCAAIPFIASDLPEQRVLGDGRIGRFAKTPNQWREHLEALTDPQVRYEEGLANYERAKELSIQNMWVQWDAVFKELLANN